MLTSSDSSFILLVDDNPTNLAVLSDVLGSAGFQLRIAMDGESALAILEEHRPELILLDVKMPDMSGFEVCRRIKTNSATQAIPIIFATASADADSTAKGFALGAVDYIPKPFQQTEVLARVKVHLQLKQLRESLEAQVRDRTVALQQAQVQLVQQEKLSSLGEMMAGIAHEINNPISFIANNVAPLREHWAAIAKVLTLYQQEHITPSPQLKEAIEEAELDFVLDDVAKILDSFTLGTERIRNISTSLRTFSRADSETKMPIDLHDCLETTLMILHHRLKAKGDRPEIKVHQSYGPLPAVHCYPGQINQVFMNLLANAIDALEEALQQGKLHDSVATIHIATQVATDGKVAIQIADNGMGIPETIQDRLFEPLFTTKPIGKGTGLGLAIAQQIVIEKHGGTITCDSVPGEGTMFAIALPITG